MKQETLIAGEATQQVSVFPLRGVIGAETDALFEKYLSAAEHDANVKAVVLDIDTPGGDVTASDEIYARIKRFKERKNVPVVVTMGGLATSGGYYVSCAADFLYAQRTTLTGNIGVLWPRYNVAQLAEKWGVKETTIASSNTPYKNAGSMFQPERAEDTAYLQGLVNSAYERFTAVVKEGRKNKLRNPDGSTPGKDITQIANGKAYTSSEALKLGLVDDLGYSADAYAKAAQLAGLAKPNVVKYTRLPTLFEAFGANSNLAPPSASAALGTVTINGVDLRLDRNVLQELATPRLMYLWRGE
jgi:protease-4